MNQGRKQIESCILNQQWVIQATGHIFQVMQFTGNIPKNDEQYLPRVTVRRSIGKIYGRFRNTSKNHGRTRGKDDQVFKDSRKTQSVFQKVKMRLQYGGNPYPRSYSREGIGQDETKKDKSSEGVKDTNKSQGCGKFPWVCKLLPTCCSNHSPEWHS